MFIFLFYKSKHPRTESNKSVALSRKFLTPAFSSTMAALLIHSIPFLLCALPTAIKFKKTPHFHDPSHIQTWGAKPVIAAQECKSSISCPKLLHRNDCLGLHHQHYCCSMKEKNKTNINGGDGRTAMNTQRLVKSLLQIFRCLPVKGSYANGPKYWHAGASSCMYYQITYETSEVCHTWASQVIKLFVAIK